MRACDYYGVSADYLLGRTEEAAREDMGELRSLASGLRAMADRAEKLAEGGK